MKSQPLDRIAAVETDPFKEYFKEDEILDDFDHLQLDITDDWGQLTSKHEPAPSTDAKISTLLMFKEVCRMWLNYYTNKPKEGLKLEANTNFRCNIFMSTRQKLLNRSKDSTHLSRTIRKLAP